MPVGYAGVVNFAYVHSGAALGVVANANDGWGNAVGGDTVTIGEQTPPTAYYVELEIDSGPGVVLMETTGKILLEIS